MYYGFYYDWTYILVLIGVVLSLLASSQVKEHLQNIRKSAVIQG